MATVTDIESWQSCILRTTNAAQATALASSGLTDAQIQNQLLEQSDTSTIPALLVYSLMLGQTQDPSHLDSNAAFALNQFNSYTAKGVLDPNLGPYEAMGLALSREAGFESMTAGKSVTQVITDFYLQASNGINPSGAQIQHFMDQYNYFVSIYSLASDPDFASHAQQEALGAVVGQIIGVFGEQEGSSLDLRADHFLLGCIDGSSNFGGPLPTLHEFDLTIGVDAGAAFTTAEHGAVFNAQPASNAPLGLTNTLNTGDNLQDSAGDGTLNFTAVADSSGFGNPAFADNVTMHGISTVNINNISGGDAGFDGDIVGLKTVTVMASSDGSVTLGDGGNEALKTALQTVNINASEDFTAFIAAAAFTGSDAITVALGGVDTTVDLEVVGSTNGYAKITVASNGSGPNTLDLETNATNTAEIDVTGAQNLDIFGSALDIANLHTFNGSAATGKLHVDFDGTGHVAATGGSNDDIFHFFSDGGAVTFTSASSVDGGGGNDVLGIQAPNGGDLLLSGVGPNITNVETIQSFGDVFGILSVDMARAGSATTLDLAADYHFNNVVVTDLTNAMHVQVDAAADINDLTLGHAAPNTVVDTISLDLVADGASHTGVEIDGDLIVTSDVEALLLSSTGDPTAAGSATNFIDGANLIDTNISITGDTNLSIGEFDGFYNFANGEVDAHTFTGNLSIWLGSNHQSVLGGSGNDFVELTTSSGLGLGQADVVDLSVGGSDTVQFDAVTTNSSGSLATSLVPTADDYHHVAGFSSANDGINIEAGSISLQTTDFSNNVVGGDTAAIYDYVNGTAVNIGTTGATTEFNFIKFTQAVAVDGNDAQLAFNVAMQGTGDITIDTAGDHILAAYYDSTHSDMVLFRADSGGNNHITAGDHVDVVGTIAMSFADYQAFNASNLHFV